MQHFRHMCITVKQFNYVLIFIPCVPLKESLFNVIYQCFIVKLIIAFNLIRFRRESCADNSYNYIKKLIFSFKQ